MMLKILVVEDDLSYYEDYLLRLLGNLLPMEKLEFTHTTSIAGALEKMSHELWDVILMDYAMGPAIKVEETKVVIRDGKDLVAFRRSVETAPSGTAPGEKMPASFIIGTSSNQVGNRLMVEAGANTSSLKNDVQAMAQEISQRLEAHG